MTDVVSGLRLYPTFRDLAPGVLDACAALWEPRQLAAGARLWEQGGASDGVAIVLRGEVEAIVDGAPLGRIGNGGILGEATGFFEGGRRTATVVATQAVSLAVLPASGLVALRAGHPDVYAALLGQALHALVRRVLAADRRIEARATGDVPMPVRAERGGLARMWRKLVPGTPRGECPPIVPLLRRLPALADADPADVDAIAALFVPEAVPEGHVLFFEGDAPDGAWLLASGSVDVLRAVRGDRAERIATLQAGDLLGINTLVEGALRTASGVTAAPSWLWRVSPASAASLTGTAAIAWRECLLTALAAQLELAHTALRRVSAGTHPLAEEEVGALHHVQGYLEGLPVSAGELARLRLLRAR